MCGARQIRLEEGFGEASHPGPPLLRRLRRRRDVLFEISSDEEPLVRGIDRNVVARVARVESAADATQVETSLATVPATQTALIEAGREAFPVGADVLDALEADLDRVDVEARSSDFVVLIQNRFSVLNSTVRDTDDDFTHTVLDGASVEVFPMGVQVPIEPPRHRPYRRLVLIPQSQGTPRSVQDLQSDESEGDHIHAQVRNSAPSTDGVRRAGESFSVDQGDGDVSGDEDTESLRDGTDRDGGSTSEDDHDSGPIAEIDPGPRCPQ